MRWHLPRNAQVWFYTSATIHIETEVNKSSLTVQTCDYHRQCRRLRDDQRPQRGVGFNYIMQNDVDNRKKANPTWKIVGTAEDAPQRASDHYGGDN